MRFSSIISFPYKLHPMAGYTLDNSSHARIATHHAVPIPTSTLPVAKNNKAPGSNSIKYISQIRTHTKETGAATSLDTCAQAHGAIMARRSRHL